MYIVLSQCIYLLPHQSTKKFLFKDSQSFRKYLIPIFWWLFSELHATFLTHAISHTRFYSIIQSASDPHFREIKQNLIFCTSHQLIHYTNLCSLMARSNQVYTNVHANAFSSLHMTLIHGKSHSTFTSHPTLNGIFPYFTIEPLLSVASPFFCIRTLQGPSKR